MMKKTYICLAALFLTLFSSVLHAKILEGRIGTGMIIMDFNRSAAFSIKFHPSRYMDIAALVGFDTDETKNATVFGGQLHRYFSLEENLNFFLGIGMYALSEKDSSATSGNTTGMEFDGLVGAEFFFTGLPNLGFQFQTGVGIKTLRKLSVKVLGDGFAGIGIHYYL